MKFVYLVVISALLISVLSASADLSYDVSQTLTKEYTGYFVTDCDSPQVSGIDVMPSLLPGQVLIHISPKDHSMAGIWAAYGTGVYVFDDIITFQTDQGIYRCMIVVPINGKKHIIEMDKADLSDANIPPKDKWNVTEMMVNSLQTAAEMVNRVKYENPMDDAIDGNALKFRNSYHSIQLDKSCGWVWGT